MNINIKSFFYGLTFSLLLAVISQYLSLYFGALFFGLEKSPISPILVALLLGILLGNQFDIQSRSLSGLQFCMKQVLRFGIILMGIRLGLLEIINFGLKSLTVVVPCIIITIIAAKIISDRFGLILGFLRQLLKYILVILPYFLIQKLKRSNYKNRDKSQKKPKIKNFF